MDSLVRKEVGQLPILIVAGHGGSAKEQTPLGALQRRLLVERQPPAEGDAAAGAPVFRTLADARSSVMAGELARELELRSGGRRPYLVAARFARKYVDVNRSIEDGALPGDDACGNARRLYEMYHGAIGELVEEMRREYAPAGIIVLDMHGHALRDEARTVFIGTRNGRTVRSRAALYAADGVLGLLAQHMAERGLGAVRPASAAVREEQFTGGFTVERWGQHCTGIDAVQLEFGRTLRSVDEEGTALVRAQAVAAVADALDAAGFLHQPRLR